MATFAKAFEGNIIIGQSGGPSAAINATLSGIVRELQDRRFPGRIYGSLYGISGIQNGKIREIGTHLAAEENLHLLECTPSCALGSCRVKLPAPDAPGAADVFEPIFARFEEYGIGAFLLIGGNDSMDTVNKLSCYADTHSKNVTVVGVSKTIDNDIEAADHTPGYGSAAKYIATVCEEICGDVSIYETKAVTVVELMGRDAGWLTAASALPRLYGLPCPDFVCLPEVPFREEVLLDSLRASLEKKPYAVVAVSEGIRNEAGEYAGSGFQNGTADIFGHKYLAGAGKYIESLVRANIGCKVRSIELSLPQRCSGHCLSATDIRESVMVGREAAAAALAGKNGAFAVILRGEGPDYRAYTSTVPVSLAANSVRPVPLGYIVPDGLNVTDDLLRYIAPLIEGEVEIPRRSGLPLRFTL